MCLILVDWNSHPNYLLVIAANRDEFHGRASLAAHWWADDNNIYGGRDLEANGTWMAINSLGRFAAVTNVRKPSNDGVRSRGELAVNFLRHTDTDLDSYLNDLKADSNEFNGYNFLAFDGIKLGWFNNVANTSQILKPSVFALSNASLDTPWPKVERIKSEYHSISLVNDPGNYPGNNPGDDLFIEQLFQILRDKQTAKDEELPNTGIEIALERRLSPIFIEGDTYGTRCSTIFTLSHSGQAKFLERRFDLHKNLIGETSSEFEINKQGK